MRHECARTGATYSDARIRRVGVCACARGYPTNIMSLCNLDGCARAREHATCYIVHESRVCGSCMQHSGCYSRATCNFSTTTTTMATTSATRGFICSLEFSLSLFSSFPSLPSARFLDKVNSQTCALHLQTLCSYDKKELHAVLVVRDLFR